MNEGKKKKNERRVLKKSLRYSHCVTTTNVRLFRLRRYFFFFVFLFSFSSSIYFDPLYYIQSSSFCTYAQVQRLTYTFE